ncbi:MAG: cyclic nucleotide-binding domain-containing protein [Deltaproteobacteria bacterium]|nr:cyclic nucleotide-binding domain-containing protein [Deltaproteobacteria bacterium]
MFEDARTLRERAQAAAARGKWDEAVEDYRRLLVKQPGDLGARQKLADGLRRTGQTALAVEEYEGVIRAYAADGFVLKAMAMCKHVLTLDPSRTAVRDMLGQLATARRAAPLQAPPPPRDEDSARLELPRAEDVDAAVAAVVSAEVSAEVLESRPALPPLTPATTVDPERMRVTAVPEVVLDLRKAPHIPLFGDLTPDEFADLFARLAVRHAAAGDVLVREGDPGESMLVIVQGSAVVQRPGRLGRAETVATLRAGACFGEMALVSRAPRIATVVAAEDCILMELTRADLAEVVAAHPGVAAVIEKFHRTRLLHNVLRASPVFRGLAAPALQALVDAFQRVRASDGDEVIRQGTAATGLHLLLRGRCAVSARRPDGTTGDLPEMKEGDVFGEISLFLGTQATATVRASGPCELLVLPAEAFERLVRPDPEVARALATLGETRLRRLGIDVEIDVYSA